MSGNFDGTVTDNGSPVAGLTVQFGGVLAKYHLTATVQQNGTYEVTEILPNLAAGTGTAQTHNAAGKASNVAMDFHPRFEHRRDLDIAPTPLPATRQTGGHDHHHRRRLPLRGRRRVGGRRLAELPQGVAVDNSGNLFIADTCNDVIREVNASTGAITTVAGNGTCGYSGDGGAATNAELDAPTGIAVDAAGDLFIADSGNDVIREVNYATGVITTVAGNGTYGYSGDGGAATGAELGFPNAVAVDGDGRSLHRRQRQQRRPRGRSLHGRDHHGRGKLRSGQRLQRRRRGGHRRPAELPRGRRGRRRRRSLHRRQPATTSSARSISLPRA